MIGETTIIISFDNMRDAMIRYLEAELTSEVTDVSRVKERQTPAPDGDAPVTQFEIVFTTK